MPTSDFRKGQAVKFEFPHRAGTTKGKGTVVCINPSRRVTVQEDVTNRKLSLWPSQLRAA